MNSGLNNNMKIFANYATVDCYKCKMRTSKILPFPMHDLLVMHCFDLVHSDVWGITTIVSHLYYK